MELECAIDFSLLNGIHRETGEITHEKKIVIDKVCRQLKATGYIHILNFDIEPTRIQQSVEYAREFFNLTIEQKLVATSKDRARRGYSPMDTENFASLIGAVGPNDTVEKFRCGPMLSDEEKEVEADAAYFSTKSGRVHFFPNCWEGVPPSFREAVTGLYGSLSSVALDLLVVLALGLHLPRDIFVEHMSKHTSILSFNHYPDLTSARTNTLSSAAASPPSAFEAASTTGEEASLHQVTLPLIRVAEHTDVSVLTLVQQTDPGLQIKSSSASSSDPWITVPCVPGSLFVHVGDCLQHWSRGRLSSTVHRVVELPQPAVRETASSSSSGIDSRLSIALFVTPNYDTPLLWPEVVEEGMSSASSSVITETLTFDVWRKKKIAESIAIMKRKSHAAPKK